MYKYNCYLRSALVKNSLNVWMTNFKNNIITHGYSRLSEYIWGRSTEKAIKNVSWFKKMNQKKINDQGWRQIYLLVFKILTLEICEKSGGNFCVLYLSIARFNWFCSITHLFVRTASFPLHNCTQMQCISFQKDTPMFSVHYMYPIWTSIRREIIPSKEFITHLKYYTGTLDHLYHPLMIKFLINQDDEKSIFYIGPGIVDVRLFHLPDTNLYESMIFY